MTDIRNSMYNSLGTIDCEIKHPVYGWIPFTASPDDVEVIGTEIYNEIILANNTLPYIAPNTAEALVVARDSAELTRMAFMLALDNAELYDTALALVNNVATPRKIKIMWDNASTFERMHPDLITMAAAIGLTDADMDAVFGL